MQTRHWHAGGQVNNYKRSTVLYSTVYFLSYFHRRIQKQRYGSELDTSTRTGEVSEWYIWSTVGLEIWFKKGLLISRFLITQQRKVLLIVLTWVIPFKVSSSIRFISYAFSKCVSYKIESHLGRQLQAINQYNCYSLEECTLKLQTHFNTSSPPPPPFPQT